MSLLTVQGLTTEFQSDGRWLRAVDGVTFELQPGEILGLVGESGCGKSTTAYSIMRLLPRNARTLAGKVWLDGEELLSKDEDEMRRLRGSRLAMIFQDPMTSLDPVFTVGEQLVETVQEHLGLTHAQAWERAMELFRQVGIPAPAERLRAYPHQFSGGMRQRIALAIAISCHPRVLIADEPTTALDVTIQAQILHLIKRLLVQEQGTAVLLITHDLGIVAQVCDRVAVMYAGEIVEVADTVSLFSEPRHPYTQALLSSLPGRGSIEPALSSSKGSPRRGAVRGQLATIEGTVPDLANLPAGCHFHPRCRHARPICSQQPPPRVKLPHEREVACVLYTE
jgi:oligopeptide/dipeptide ABC transporter ATP-binding protein